MNVVASDESALALARLLNSNARAKPVVVVSSPAGAPRPFIDPHTVADQVGDLADVYLIETGPQSWAFSKAMPAMTQVYGGAGRAYPVGTAWVAEPWQSPLRFAWNAAEGDHASERLIGDALRMASAAGLLRTAPARRMRVAGEVQRLVPPTRALVKTDDGRIAVVWQELLRPDVAVARVLKVGMRVAGLLDLDSKRYDLRESALPVSEALEGYTVGDVVLAEVMDVGQDASRLRLHPDVVVTVGRDDITSNQLDLVSSLMTPGEVLAVRLLSAGPAWRLSLLDVDDDELPLPAPPLLRGGPPWLLPAPPEAVRPCAVTDEGESPPPTADLEQLVDPDGARPAALPPTAAPPPTAAGGVPPVPDPRWLDPRRRADVLDSGATSEEPLQRRFERVTSALRRAQEQIASLMRSAVELRSEHQLLRNELQRSKAQVRRLEIELKEARTGLRKARQQAARQGRARERREALFLDPEDQLRHDVHDAWARRIPAPDKAGRPLADYVVGPVFLPSMSATDGIDRDKVLDVIVEVLTGLADTLPGREMHQLRTSLAGGAPPVTRADGATCWRVALQVNAPQARRLHFWRLRNGTVELSRVTLHDDFMP